MAELLPSTSEKLPIEKLGLGLLIADTTSHDPNVPTGPVVEIQHTESSQNVPDGESESAAVVMADVVEESAAIDEEVKLRNALERDLCQLTIEQAEIETARDRFEAVDEEEGKNVVVTVKLDNLHEEKGGKNDESVEVENENGRGNMENEGTMKLDYLHEEKGGEDAESFEDENKNGWGNMKNEGTVKLDDLHEEKGGKNAENGWGYMENEGTVKLDYIHEEKVGKNAESFEDENKNGWGNMKNEGTVKLDYLHEEKGGKNAESVEYETENGWGNMENKGTVMKLDYVHEVKGGKNVEIFEYENDYGWGNMENEGTVKLDYFHEEKGGRNVESAKYENDYGWGTMENKWGNEKNDGNVGSQSRDAATTLGRYNQSNNNMSINYPMRPDAEDCAFYMRSGSCKFGLNCKFNHPPRRRSQGVKERVSYSEENSERAGQTECKYYLTSGGCRYGKDCKYSHGPDKSSKSQILEFNFLGLPIRSGEKECSYYMRTGTCKYGSSCRFHHPEPTTVVGADSSSGYGNGGSIPSQLVSSSSISSWSSPRAFNETSSFTPVMFSQTQRAPTSDTEWNGYQAATYPTSERNLPTPPAFALNNLPTEINFPLPHQHDMVLEEYPERPGEPECSFFMKTGNCKYKSNCKFHHPKNHITKARATSCTLNDKGLPLRPDEPICTHYHRYGICKYGPACKYDHPSSFANLPTPFDQPPFSNLKMAGGSQ